MGSEGMVQVRVEFQVSWVVVVGRGSAAECTEA